VGRPGAAPTPRRWQQQAPERSTAATAVAGHYVVGLEEPATGVATALRWDAVTGQVLSRLAMPNASVIPLAVNSAGQATAATMIWGPSGRTWLPPDGDPAARAITDDGRVGGRVAPNSHQVAAIWTCVPAHGGPLRPRP
jgi:hypothetical protein